MPGVRLLRLSDMVLRRRGGPARHFVQIIVSIALRLFFRRIETSDEFLVPPDGPVVFVLNHPNGLIDPALVLCALPRPISFLAKSTLFKLPVVSWMLRQLDPLPLYRRIDAGEDISQNQQTFEACRRLLLSGGAIALFPEGISHNQSRLLPMKTGAARIALGAVSVHNATFRLLICPVGIYYTSKSSVRSEVLLRFGRPFPVKPVILSADGDPPRDAVAALSAEIRSALEVVTLNVEDDEELDLVRKTGRLLSSIYTGLSFQPTLTERFDVLQRVASALGISRNSDQATLALPQRIAAFEKRMNEVGLKPEELAISASSFWYVLRFFILRVALLLICLPLTILGILLYAPAYIIASLLANRFQKHGADEAFATVRILGLILFVPLTWLVVSGIAWSFGGWRQGLASLPISIICGYAAMRSIETAADLRSWFKASLKVLRSRRTLLELLIERRAIQRQLEELSV
jgi:glycerol-3-phosphate O-acyltransferase/dihydroxyacetone phosphate acyltransferase